jgi:hypothetical protein
VKVTPGQPNVTGTWDIRRSIVYGNQADKSQLVGKEIVFLRELFPNFDVNADTPEIYDTYSKWSDVMKNVKQINDVTNSGLGACDPNNWMSTLPANAGKDKIVVTGVIPFTYPCCTVNFIDTFQKIIDKMEWAAHLSQLTYSSTLARGSVEACRNFASPGANDKMFFLRFGQPRMGYNYPSWYHQGPPSVKYGGPHGIDHLNLTTGQYNYRIYVTAVDDLDHLPDVLLYTNNGTRFFFYLSCALNFFIMCFGIFVIVKMLRGGNRALVPYLVVSFEGLCASPLRFWRGLHEPFHIGLGLQNVPDRKFRGIARGLPQAFSIAATFWAAFLFAEVASSRSAPPALKKPYVIFKFAAGLTPFIVHMATIPELKDAVIDEDRYNYYRLLFGFDLTAASLYVVLSLFAVLNIFRAASKSNASSLDSAARRLLKFVLLSSVGLALSCVFSYADLAPYNDWDPSIRNGGKYYFAIASALYGPVIAGYCQVRLLLLPPSEGS